MEISADQPSGEQLTFKQKMERKRRAAEDRDYSVTFKSEEGITVVRSRLTPDYEAGHFKEVSVQKEDPAVYAEQMGKIASGKELLTDQADILTASLATANYASELSSEANEVFNLLSEVTWQASRTTTEGFEALPEDVKELVKRSDRLVQLRHILGGSTYVTPMGDVYSREDATACIDDYCSSLEESLTSTIQARGVALKVEIGRPSRVQFINSTANLMHVTLARINENRTLYGEEPLGSDIFNDANKKVVGLFAA
jgi:hypothetical protein